LKSSSGTLIVCLIILFVLICFPVPFVFADEVDTSKNSNVETPTINSRAQKEDSTFVLDEVVVTATKTPKTVAEVPQAVTFITAEEISKTGSLNTSETFQRVPGVAVHDYNSVGFGNQFYVRGYDYLRIYNNLDFQIDGVTIHSAADYGNPVLNSIPKVAIDHIEFLRGPAAAMYGQQASIGVVNTSIKRPYGGFTGEVSLGYGSYDQRHVGMSLSGSKDRFSCLLAADYSTGDTYTDYQSFQSQSVLFAPTIRLGGNTRVEGTLLVSKRTVDNPIATYLTEEQIEGDRTQNFDRGELKAPLTFLGLGVIHDFGNSVEWVTKAGYVSQKEEAYITGDGSGNSWYDYGYDYNSERPLDSYGIESHVNWFDLGTEGSILTTGLEFHLDDAEQKTSWGGFPDKDSHTEVYNYALFAQYEWKTTNALTFTGGARADFYRTDFEDRLDPSASFDDEDDSAVSPRIGINYEIFHNFNVFGSFGTGYRVPSAYELAADSSLDSEKSMNYEAGIKFRLLKNWDASVSYYRTDYQDLILNWGEIDPDTSEWISVYDNVGEARFEGFEIANYFNFGLGITGYLHFLLDYSKFIDYKSDENATSPFDYSDNPVPYHPQNQVKLGLEYSGHGCKVGFDGRYFGDYYSDTSGDYKADDYFNLDLHVSYTFKSTTLTFFLSNVFDEEYYASAWRDTQYPAAGRNVFCELSFKF
jgi:outer membrane receptor protein involved in Fe transport